MVVRFYRVSQMEGVGRADLLLYFKCPTAKQMRCPVNAYKNSMDITVYVSSNAVPHSRPRQNDILPGYQKQKISLVSLKMT